MKNRTVDAIQLSDGSVMPLGRALNKELVYLSEIYRGRGIESTYVAREVNGERYWIVSKALFDRRWAAEVRQRRGY